MIGTILWGLIIGPIFAVVLMLSLNLVILVTALVVGADFTFFWDWGMLLFMSIMGTVISCAKELE